MCSGLTKCSVHLSYEDLLRKYITSVQGGERPGVFSHWCEKKQRKKNSRNICFFFSSKNNATDTNNRKLKPIYFGINAGQNHKNEMNT